MIDKIKEINERKKPIIVSISEVNKICKKIDEEMEKLREEQHKKLNRSLKSKKGETILKSA